MASKIDSVMSTSIALDTLKASKGINTLAQAVRASTNAWKAQEAQAKSAGDYLKASESRYKGLSDAIEIQQKKIETIKDKMKDLDQTTQSGAKQWVKYQSDLQNASKQLQSMEAQQKRAGENLRREKSGINDLSAAMKRRNALSEAFVARLESEGKHEQALKEKRDNARKSINDTVSALKKEEYLLKSMERSGGSETAINKQRIAIEKLKTSLNESRKSVSKYDEQLERLNPSPINRIKERFSGLNREGRKTHSIFKSVFAANIVSNAFTNSIGAISLKLHEAWDSAMEYAKAQQTMNASWLTLTGNAKEGKKMVNMTNEMAASFANSTDMVNDLNQKFYAISNSSKTTRDLTKDVLTLQDAFGQSDDAVKNFSTQWSQMMANGKVSAQDMMSFVNVFPKIRTELLKTEQKITGNSKLSMKQMNDMMSAGEISSDTMKKVLDNMQKEYSGATANFGKTFDGMKRTITARVPALLNAFTGPFLNAKNPLMGAVSKWVSDKNTEKEFAKLGGVASKGFSTVSKAFAKALDFKPTNNTGEKIVKGMSSGITSLSKTIASHANQIVGFFKGLWNSVKIIGSIGAGFFKGLASALNSVATPLAKMTGHNKKINGLSDSLGELSKHKSGLQTLGKVLAGVFITSKALGFASAITKVGEAMGLLKKSYTPLQLFGKGLNLVKDGFVKLTTVMMANPFIAIAAAIAAVGVGLFELYKHNKKFRDMVNGWGKAISKFTSGALKGIGKFFSDFGKSWNNFWGGIGSGIGKAWKGASKKVSSGASSIRKAFSKKIGDISDWFGDVGKGINKWWNSFSKAFKKGFDSFVKKAKGFFKGLGKALIYAIAFPAGLAMIIFGPIVKAMNKGIKIIAKPIKQMGKVVSKAFMAIWKPLTRYVKTELTLIGKIIRQVINGWVKIIKTVGKALLKAWKVVWNALSKFLSKTLNAMGKIWKKFTNGLSKVWNSFSKAFKKSWSKVWNAISRFFSKIFNGIHKKFKDWASAISKTWNGFKKWFSKKWSNMWNGIHNFFHGITKKLSKTFSNWTSGAMNILESFGNKFKSGWNGLVKGVKSIFSGLWDSMKEMAADGLNAVIGVINKGVGGINSVIHTFGGSKQTIKPIGKVKFATGTGSLGSTSFRRAITQITPAIVNDEPGAKNPELIFRKATGNVEYLKEKNAQTVLFPGDEVANATDSATLAPMLGLTKFAKGGIGEFFGGLWNGVTGFVSNVGKKLKDLWTIGTKIIAHPIKALEGLMPFSNNGAKGFFPTMVKGGYNFVKKQASEWWKTLWSMADLNGGGAFGGSWAHTPSTKMIHTDSFGSPRSGGVHDGNDYSGPIGTLIRAVHGGKVVRAGGPPSGWGAIGYNIVTKDNDGVYVIYQEFGHAGDAKVSQGDVVKTGDPIAKLGRSGLGTGPHVHIGVSKNYPFNNNGMSTKGWYDLMKMKGSSSGKGSDVKANSSLQKLIKSQVGSGFWKMIAKLSSMFGDSGDAGGGANPGGAGVKRWKPYVIKALKALGLSTSANMVARVLRQINTESGGNPNAIGGTDGLSDGRAMGLMQVKPGTFKAYGRKGGKWNNGYDSIYAGLNYAKHRYGPSLSFLGQGHGYANGGIATTPSVFGEAGPEMAIPLSVTRSDRAKQLLGETAIRLAKTDPEKLAESQPNDASRVSDKKLYDRIDAMSNMMAKMIMLLKEQITTTKQTAFDKRHLYRTESLDQIISDYQSL